MSHALADDDVVATHADARGNARPPLLVTEPLEAYLDAHGLGAGPITATPVGEGHSNVTFVVARGGWEAVLRRPPRPPRPAQRARHAARGARADRAGGPRAGAARARDLRRRGRPRRPVLRDGEARGPRHHERAAGGARPVAERAAIADELVDALVEIHAVDWEAAGLAGLGKPDGYLERQVRRFSGIWEMTKTRELPDVERVAGGSARTGRTPRRRRSSTATSGSGNLMFAPAAPARVIAVFDWEMATLGDPLADVGYLSTMWFGPGDPVPGSFNLGPVTQAEGFPDAPELVARYEERSGRSAGDLRWYQVLAVWKATVFMETNYRRAMSGASDDPYLKGFGDTVAELAARARALAGT